MAKEKKPQKEKIEEKKEKEIEEVQEDSEEPITADEKLEPELVAVVPEEEAVEKISETVFEKEGWRPRTELGRKVKSGKITDIDEIVSKGIPILESEIVDALIPGLKPDLLLIGQAKGKFGGGQRRVFRQTQKKTQEGNKPKFATCAVIGDFNGYFGVGYGKSKETVPAREKAIRNAKKNIIKIRRGCGSWQCSCKEAHSIPFKVSGKCGSVKVILLPAPKGTGLLVEQDCAKILKFAGIKDVWSQTRGQTRTRINLISALFDALKMLSKTKVQRRFESDLGIVDGRIKEERVVEQ
ncbi:MAG TPA: 30S ribosomal protein S5 [Candidatus Nanoarchaeia archaeon]|nr:30S ribosomal protein S5 [Candidatus Nanoarchaeia archaeon]